MATLSGRPSSTDTKRLRLGKHGAKECHLNFKLWAKLPEALLEEILRKLPFSSLMRFCSVCKRWRDLILSKTSNTFPRSTAHHSRLFCFSKGQLNVLKSNGAAWETIPLQFLEEKQFALQNVLTSAGGLLCFSTVVGGEFVVCNPLTKWYKTLHMPSGFLPGVFDQLCVPQTYPIGVSFSARNYLKSDFLVVGMTQHSDLGHFRLIAATFFPHYHKGSTATFVYDSRADSWNSWKRVSHVPVSYPSQYPGAMELDFCFKMQAPISCGGNLYFHSYDFGRSYMDDPRDVAFEKILLKYNWEEQRWSWISIPTGREMRLNSIIEHKGNITLMTRRYEDYMMVHGKVFQLHENLEPIPWQRLNRSSHFPGIQEAMPNMQGIESLGQGNVIFFIKKRAFRPSIDFTRITCVRVWYHDGETDSGLISNWKDYIDGDDNFWDWQIFTPSTLNPPLFQ